MQQLRKITTCIWLVFVHYWHASWWHKAVAITVAIAMALTGVMYGIGQWYIASEQSRPPVLGASFVADYAAYLGVDPHQTLAAMLDDLGVKHLRLVSYWSDIERERGSYDFSELDWEFAQAASHGAKVSLAIGLRQPRWPECHIPDRAASEPMSEWYPQLTSFMTAVINRYKKSPALESYQLENEYFLQAFGTCKDATRTRLEQEAALVRHLDPHHTLIISRSQNAIGWPVGTPHADEYAISIYRRVWSSQLHRYLEYPFPAWYYAFLAGAEKLWSGKDTMIHELQAESWPPEGTTNLTSTLTEQDNTMNTARLNNTIVFAKATGMRQMDLWGAEYWYYRMVSLHDPSLWGAARQAFQENKT